PTGNFRRRSHILGKWSVTREFLDGNFLHPTFLHRHCEMLFLSHDHDEFARTISRQVARVTNTFAFGNAAVISTVKFCLKTDAARMRLDSGRSRRDWSKRFLVSIRNRRSGYSYFNTFSTISSTTASIACVASTSIAFIL